jgi:hypothetical protein
MRVLSTKKQLVWNATLGLRRDYPLAKHDFVAVHRMKHSKALEDFVHGLSEEWKQKCTGHLCPQEIFYSKDYPVEDVWSTAKEALAMAQRRLHEKLVKKAQMRLPANSISPSEQSDEQTPFVFGRKGKSYAMRAGRSHPVEISEILQKKEKTES